MFGKSLPIEMPETRAYNKITPRKTSLSGVKEEIAKTPSTHRNTRRRRNARYFKNLISQKRENKHKSGGGYFEGVRVGEE